MKTILRKRLAIRKIVKVAMKRGINIHVILAAFDVVPWVWRLKWRSRWYNSRNKYENSN